VAEVDERREDALAGDAGGLLVAEQVVERERAVAGGRVHCGVRELDERVDGAVVDHLVHARLVLEQHAQAVRAVLAHERVAGLDEHEERGHGALGDEPVGAVPVEAQHVERRGAHPVRLHVVRLAGRVALHAHLHDGGHGALLHHLLPARHVHCQTRHRDGAPGLGWKLVKIA
jgi:hypothetical protein